MRIDRCISLATLIFLFPAMGMAQNGLDKPPEGFSRLFNEQDFNGWHGMTHFDPRRLAEMDADARQSKLRGDTEDAKRHWRIDQGMLVNDGQGAYLTTDKSFRDFELLAEYRTVAKADSGIYLKATPQIQIWDYTEAGGKWDRGADKGSGGLWNNSSGAAGKYPRVLADRPFGQWNQLRIRQVGARTSVWLNNQLVVDHALMENYWDRAVPLFVSGPIQLQTHGGEISWRNIFIREIPVDEANRILSDADDKEFERIFNERDLSGWQGATADYVVENGALRCRSGRGGNLYTIEEYDDFEVRLQFQLPPAGNNGLAIRYPGTGDPAYTGMCELQVLDSNHPKYAHLDARQHHGAAYGLAAAHRGFLRPTGEWNFQQVAVRGSHLTVELNGSRILDFDLADTTESLEDRPHPGKNRKAGYFGFCGHNDPVRYRHVRVRHIAVNH